MFCQETEAESCLSPSALSPVQLLGFAATRLLSFQPALVFFLIDRENGYMAERDKRKGQRTKKGERDGDRETKEMRGGDEMNQQAPSFCSLSFVSSFLGLPFWSNSLNLPLKPPPSSGLDMLMQSPQTLSLSAWPKLNSCSQEFGAVKHNRKSWNKVPAQFAVDLVQVSPPTVLMFPIMFHK